MAIPGDCNWSSGYETLFMIAGHEINIRYDETDLPTRSSGRTVDNEPSVGPWGYRSYRQHLADRFPGRHIRKLALDAGFTCPNLDGAVARGGCAYCDNAAFAPSLGEADLQQQWNKGRRLLRERHRRVDGFIAYFQAFSNTYASLERLQAIYDPMPQAFSECVGIAIGTRPDCLPDEAIDYCHTLGQRTFTTIEIGLQSDSDVVLQRMNRGHSRACFDDAIHRCANKSFELCVHVMLGVPGEGADAPQRLGRLLGSLPIHSVKIHNLHVVRGTAWARAYAQGQLQAPEAAWYIQAAQTVIEHLRPDQSVQRLVADAPYSLLMSGHWCRKKQTVLAQYHAAQTSPITQHGGGAR